MKKLLTIIGLLSISLTSFGSVDSYVSCVSSLRNEGYANALEAQAYCKVDIQVIKCAKDLKDKKLAPFDEAMGFCYNQPLVQCSKELAGKYTPFRNALGYCQHPKAVIECAKEFQDQGLLSFANAWQGCYDHFGK